MRVKSRRNGMRAGTIAAQTIGPFLPPTLWTLISRLRGKADTPADIFGYAVG